MIQISVKSTLHHLDHTTNLLKAKNGQLNHPKVGTGRIKLDISRIRTKIKKSYSHLSSMIPSSPSDRHLEPHPNLKTRRMIQISVKSFLHHLDHTTNLPNAKNGQLNYPKVGTCRIKLDISRTRTKIKKSYSHYSRMIPSSPSDRHLEPHPNLVTRDGFRNPLKHFWTT